MKLLLAGFVLSLMGSLPPGLISLTVSHTAIIRGLAAAIMLALGAAFAEFFQAWAAVMLSDWFLRHPSVETGFRWAAMVVFFALAIYLLFFAQAPHAPQDVPKISAVKQFFKGIVVSAFNLLAIPYWFAYCGWLKVEGWWDGTGLGSTLIFSFGVSLGTTFALLIYVWLGALILRQAGAIARHANRLIGIIFLVLALKVLVDLLK